jgi:chromosome partitioning protein
MNVIAVYNSKGGVGKTAAAVNLAFLAARGGLRTLVWDLDPQGAATFYFRVKPKVKGGGRKLIKKGRLDDYIKATDYENLDLMPADFSYRHLDIRLEQKKKPGQCLKKLLDPLRLDYDLAVLDSPPSISLVSESIFGASDVLLVPVIPTTLSRRTLEQLYAFRCRKLKRQQLLVFFSMVDRRKKLHAEMMRSIADLHPEVLRTCIPSATQVERMGVFRKPIGAFSPGCAAAQAYEELWTELQTAMGSYCDGT